MFSCQKKRRKEEKVDEQAAQLSNNNSSSASAVAKPFSTKFLSSAVYSLQKLVSGKDITKVDFFEETDPKRVVTRSLSKKIMNIKQQFATAEDRPTFSISKTIQLANEKAKITW